jgi:hypothetical protein
MSSLEKHPVVMRVLHALGKELSKALIKVTGYSGLCFCYCTPLGDQVVRQQW